MSCKLLPVIVVEYVKLPSEIAAPDTPYISFPDKVNHTGISDVDVPYAKIP